MKAATTSSHQHQRICDQCVEFVERFAPERICFMRESTKARHLSIEGVDPRGAPSRPRL